MEKFSIINRTNFPTYQFKQIVYTALEGKSVPNFYLICQTPNHDGLTITNLDKPLIIVTVESLHQFANVFVHELVHLQQHSKDFASEDFDSEVFVTDKYRTVEDSKKINPTNSKRF